MYNQGAFSRPKLELKSQPYVPDELIVTTKTDEFEREIPHYLNVRSAVAEKVRSFGNNDLDRILLNLNIRTDYIARVFVPEVEVKSALDQNRALSRSMIGNNYSNQEKAKSLSRVFKVKLDKNLHTVEGLCEELLKSDGVEDARPNYISEAFIRPSDSFYAYQWGLAATDCESGWDIEQGLDNVKMAVVDTGVDMFHEDLATKLIAGFDLVDYQGGNTPQFDLLGDFRQRDNDPSDENGHGTHCAGIMAASSNNGQGISGVCWGGQIIPVRVLFQVFDRFNQVTTSIGTDIDIDAGIKYAVDAGADVINLSLGGSNPSHDAVVQYAYDRNVCLIAAMGNSNTSQANYPAANPKVLAVGAINESLQRANFSNYGPAYNRFVMAPGVAIASTYINNSYQYLDGTSMAAPFVSGLAGLIISVAKRRGANYMVNDIYDIIRESAIPQRNGRGDTFFGEGIVNVRNALELAQQRFGFSASC